MGQRKKRYYKKKRNHFKKKAVLQNRSLQLQPKPTLTNDLVIEEDKNRLKSASRTETEHEDPKDSRPRFEYDIRPVAQLVADKEENCEKPFDVVPNAVIDVPAVTIKTEDPLDCDDNSEYNIIIEESTIQDNEFPKDPESASKWIDATGRKNWFPTKRSTICSSHFLETDYNQTKKARRLLYPQACPTVDIWNAPSNSTVEASTSHSGLAGEEVHIKEERDDDTESMIIEISLKNDENSTAQDAEKNTEDPVFTFNRLEYVNKLKLQLARSQKALELKDKQVKNLQRKLRLRNKKIEQLEEYITEMEQRSVVNPDKKRASKDTKGKTKVFAAKVVGESSH